MIENMQQLAGSLQYIAGWADMLEGLRRHALATDATLLPTTSAGPLNELRRVLAEAREYVEGLDQEVSADYHLPAMDEREKAA